MAIIEPGKPVPTWVYVAGGGVVFVGYLLYSNRRKTKAAAAAAAATTSKTAPATSQPYPVIPAASYGSGQDAGALANIQQQLASLAAAQAATTGTTSGSGTSTTGPSAPAAPPASTAYWTTANEDKVGSGYVPRADAPGGGRFAPITVNGHTYSWVTDPNVAGQIGWNNLFYQPIPGVFTPNTPGTPLLPSTPLYAQVS